MVRPPNVEVIRTSKGAAAAPQPACLRQVSDPTLEVVPVGWTSGPSKLIKTFAGRASGLVAVEDRSD